MGLVGETRLSQGSLQRRGKHLAFAAIAIGIGIAGALLLGEVLCRALPTAQLLDYKETPVLHYIPNTTYQYSKGWNFHIRNGGRINNYGFVNDQDYDEAATGPLLAVIGDSYIEALMVPYQQTAHGRVAAAVSSRGRVYSFGFSGAQLGQYLAYARYARDVFRPAGFVVNVVGNDFDESLASYAKSSRFELFLESDGKLSLQKLPHEQSRLRKILYSSALMRYLAINVDVQTTYYKLTEGRKSDGNFVGNVPARVEQKRLQDSMRAALYFLQTLPEYSGLSASRILFLVDGIRPQLYDPIRRATASESYFAAMRAYFIVEARQRGFEVVDMEERFIRRHSKDKTRFEWDIDHHWNSAGHEEAGKAILESSVAKQIFWPNH